MGLTPFGIYDNDSQFTADIVLIPEFVRRKLGLDISGQSGVNVELSDNIIYCSFEDSTNEFNALVNSYHYKSTAASLLGMLTGTLSGSENKFPFRNLEPLKRSLDIYGTEALAGGTTKIYSASLTIKNEQQDYDLNTALGITTGSGERLEIVNIWHYPPYVAYRFYSQSSYINYTLNEFGIRYFTPETAYYLLPVWEDTLRTAQYKYSHRLRRSNYSYEIKANRFRVFPIPTSDGALWLEYRITKFNPFMNDVDSSSADGVANLSNVPFGNIQYSKLNSLSKQWIRKMCLAMCKETLANVRGKFTSVPFPNGEITLNAADLLNQAQKEQDQLREDLKQRLEETTYANLAKQESERSDAEFNQIKKVPLYILIG